MSESLGVSVVWRVVHHFVLSHLAWGFGLNSDVGRWIWLKNIDAYQGWDRMFYSYSHIIYFDRMVINFGQVWDIMSRRGEGRYSHSLTTWMRAKWQCFFRLFRGHDLPKLSLERVSSKVLGVNYHQVLCWFDQHGGRDWSGNIVSWPGSISDLSLCAFDSSIPNTRKSLNRLFYHFSFLRRICCYITSQISSDLERKIIYRSGVTMMAGKVSPRLRMWKNSSLLVSSDRCSFSWRLLCTSCSFVVLGAFFKSFNTFPVM